MGGASTVLTLVKVGELWRVQIAWPNGTTKYFGKFGSEREARKWIGAHGWLTERAIQDKEIRRTWGSVTGRRVGAEVASGQTAVDELTSERQRKD